MLRRLVPRSLRARLVLLTLGTILLVQAGTMASVSHFRNQFTETVTIEIVSTTIRTLRAALAEIPAEERADFVREASRNEWRLWSRTLPSEAELERRPRRPPPPGQGRPGDHGHSSDRPPPPPRHDDLRRDLRNLVDALNTRLDDGTRVALSRGPAPRIYISLQPDEHTDAAALATREWLVIPLDRLSPPVATPLVAMWLAGMGVILLISAAFSWHITRPLTRLAKAADQLAAGQPQRVVPAGPSETRALGERFNAMLDALNESDAVRRTLLAGLPHDLKGPLSRMWLRIEMMEEAALKEGLRHDLQDMQRMVDQFIGFVRGTDPANYRFTRLNLDDWLQEHVGTWESAGSDVKLLEPLPSGVVLRADGFALGRLLDNLITNALNYAAPPIEIGLSTTAAHAVMTVSDHGPGISEERRIEALRPFSRLDDARTLTGSVGLGLALCNSIARAHGGSLSLDEADSGGLKVTVRLPLAQEDEGADGAQRNT
ncbi:ATP-binding protein [Pusillimonas sp.]|uniref:ATP-binding protein n=1 Tax=Pusillimonas sp. TaxID=3040095 RepID=UPI0029B32BB6|nr:ATP-binding protein [Pusillimonas sp.]MDX3895389.1 ATP-binding protein [Pusillimonas sp.]